MKKFARVFDEFFPTEESTPNAALTGSNGADEVEQAVFELLEADFAKSGKAKTLRFAARQTRSQMRQNRLGPSSPVALSSCSLFIDDAEWGAAGNAGAGDVYECHPGQPAVGDCVASCPDDKPFVEAFYRCTASCPDGTVTGDSFNTEGCVGGGDALLQCPPPTPSNYCIDPKCTTIDEVTECEEGSLCPGAAGTVPAECTGPGPYRLTDALGFVNEYSTPCACALGKAMDYWVT